jgi:hypothetical protein
VSLDDWQKGLEVLRRSWEDADSDEDLGRHARDLFDRLDKHGLVAYAADKLLDEKHALRRTLLAERIRETEKVGDQMAEHAHLFLPAAGLAAELLKVCRADLHKDVALWLTTLPHARLEELAAELREAKLADETEEPAPALLSPADRLSLLELPRRPAAAAADYCRALAEPHFRVAADAGDDDLEDLRAQLAASAARVEGVAGLTVAFDFVFSEGRPAGLQVRLRGPAELRARPRRATLQLPARERADEIELTSGRGALPLDPLVLPVLAAHDGGGRYRGWRLELSDDAGGRWPVLLE